MIKIKRIYAAVTLLLAVLALAVTEYFTIKNVTESVLAGIVNVENEINAEDFDRAKDISAEITEDWEKYEFKLDLFLNHDNVDDIGNRLFGLSHLINKRDKSFALESTSEIKKQLASVKDSELPKIDNLI